MTTPKPHHRRRQPAQPKLGDKSCARCGRDEASSIYCNHVHRCLGRLIAVGPRSDLPRRKAHAS